MCKATLLSQEMRMPIQITAYRTTRYQLFFNKLDSVTGCREMSCILEIKKF